MPQCQPHVWDWIVLHHCLVSDQITQIKSAFIDLNNIWCLTPLGSTEPSAFYLNMSMTLKLSILKLSYWTNRAQIICLVLCQNKNKFLLAKLDVPCSNILLKIKYQWKTFAFIPVFEFLFSPFNFTFSSGHLGFKNSDLVT